MNGRDARSPLNAWGVPRALHAVGMIAVLACTAGREMFAQRAVATGDRAAEPAGVDRLLSRLVTVRLERVSRVRALDEIARVAKVPVQYRMQLLNFYPDLVTINVTNVPLGVALEHVLDGTSLRVIADGADHLAIVDSNARSGRDSTIAAGTVSGQVVDSASGRGLNGVTVAIVGTSLKTVTSDSGRFLLRNVPAGEYRLAVRLFGYRAGQHGLDVTANERTRVRVLMTTASNVLSGVVTTATGIQDRRSIGNDITVIDADSVLRIAPVRSVTELLAARVPGLTVQRTSGVPGAPSRLRLRGVGGGLIDGSANTSNDPIIIVDGIRVYSRQSTVRDANLASGGYAAASAIDQIDPNSIDKIEVFKGPSATSQWGSDAGNGVIVITTKRGQVGKTQAHASATYGVESMPGRYAAPGFYVFGSGYAPGAGESVLCNDELVSSGGDTGRCTIIDSVVRFSALDAPRLSPFGTGTSNGASATVSGGSSALTYSLTGTVGSELGYWKMPDFDQDLWMDLYGERAPRRIRRPTTYRTRGYNATFGMVPASGLRVSLVTSAYTSMQQQAAAQNTLAELASTYYDTASAKISPSNQGIEATGRMQQYYTYVTGRTATSTTTLQGDWIRWAMLPVQATVGVSTSERFDHALTPSGLKVDANYNTSGSYSTGHGLAVTRTGAINATLFPNRFVSTAVGAQLTRSSTDDFTGSTDSLSAGESSPSTLTRAGQTSFASNTAGWYVEPKLKLGDRVFATPGFRLDGGSASAARGSALGNLLSFFPKLNFSWIAVDREGESPLGGILTTLRPRIAFGIAGVQPDPTWNLRLLDHPTQIYVNTGGQTPVQNQGIVVTTLGNTQLRPERSREVESGFDADLWGSRVSVTTSLYYKRRLDAIEKFSSAPSVLGGMIQYVNLGNVRNTGVEVTLHAAVVETPLVHWGVNASYSANRNMLVTLNGGLLSTVASYGLGFVPGYPLGGRFARPIVGYHDGDGDGRLTLSDVVIGKTPVFVGSPQPKYQLPFSTDLSLWRGRVHVNAGFDYTNGVTQSNFGGNSLLTNLLFDSTASLASQAAALAAKACGAESCLANAYNDGAGTLYGLIQTINALRFNTLSVGYSVPRALSTRLRVPSLSVSLQGSNLALWTNYRGKDPDVNANAIGESVSDTGQLPLPRTWILRIDLGN